MRVLVVGGDARTAQLLERQGQVTARTTGVGEAISVAGAYDAIVVDSPAKPGPALTLCRALRAHGVYTPIVLLTDSDVATARIEALDAGADVCLSRPFLEDELLARLRAITRRTSGRLSDHERE